LDWKLHVGIVMASIVPTLAGINELGPSEHLYLI
jgi:hypothetical protein